MQLNPTFTILIFSYSQENIPTFYHLPLNNCLPYLDLDGKTQSAYRVLYKILASLHGDNISFFPFLDES